MSERQLYDLASRTDDDIETGRPVLWMKAKRFADEAFETIPFDGIAIVAAHGDPEPHGTVFIRAGMDRHTRIGRDAPRPEDTREISPQPQPAIVFEPKWMCRFAHDAL